MDIEERTWRADAREVAWWVLVGAGSGAIAGFLIGGVGGRLGMLLLRSTSPDLVLGLQSDDGFEIGVVTLKTMNLILAMTAAGAVNGVLYAALRRSISRRLRLPLWALFAAAAGGATVVHEQGVDFTLIEPVVLAVALFVALPGLAAALVVVLVERWVDREPATDRRLVVALSAAAILSTAALPFAAMVGGLAVGLRGADRLRDGARLVGRYLVPLGIGLVTVIAGVSLVSEATRII